MTIRRPVTVLTPPLCAAARTYLGWNRQQLATAAGLSLETVRNYERIARPDAPRGTSLETVVKLQQALEDAGFDFIQDGSREGFLWGKP